MTNTAIREAIERDEAAAAEVETPEPEPDTPEPEPEPEPQPQPQTEKELRALDKKINAANDANAKKLRDLIGPRFEEFFPCPLCMTDGHVDPKSLDSIEPERVDAIMGCLNTEPAPELKPMEGVERCPKCDGWGHVESPSRNEENRVKPCLECQTRGYREVIPGQDAWNIPAPVVQPIGNGYAPPPVYGEVDAWNRPAGHPHYGRDPVSVT